MCQIGRITWYSQATVSKRPLSAELQLSIIKLWEPNAKNQTLCCGQMIVSHYDILTVTFILIHVQVWQRKCFSTHSPLSRTSLSVSLQALCLKLAPVIFLPTGNDRKWLCWIWQWGSTFSRPRSWRAKPGRRWTDKDWGLELWGLTPRLLNFNEHVQ